MSVIDFYRKTDEEQNKILRDVYAYISSVKSNLIADNRFFTDSKFLEYLKATFNESQRNIQAESEFYRARRYDYHYIDDEKIGTDFEGFDREASFVNLKSDWPSFGRMNPQGIQVLYMATDVRTAITELHPYLDEVFSVAKIKAKENLRIVDLSFSGSSIDDDFSRILSIYVQEWISQGFEERDYIFSQFIASYCKYLGYDGIGYKSKYATRDNARRKLGVNYTVFNFKKCEVVESKLYRIDRVSIQVSPLKKGDFLK